jgi:hypothetical protein
MLRRHLNKESNHQTTSDNPFYGKIGFRPGTRTEIPLAILEDYFEGYRNATVSQFIIRQIETYAR